MSLRTAAKLNNTSKTTHYPLVFSSFPEESREHSGIPAIVTGSGASELPVTVDINEIISAEASALASRMKHPIAGSGSSKTLQKFRSIGNMANPVTPSEQVRALSASADTLRQRVGNSGSTRRQGDSRFDNHSHGHGHGHDPFPSSPDRDTTRTQTPHHRHHHHHLPDFSDDLVDDVSLITAGTATMIEQDHLAVMPRDNNTSLVVKPASANTIHQFREFGGIVSMEPDIGSLLSHKSPDSSSRGRHGQGQGSLTHSQSLDNGFAPGSISLHSLSGGGGDGFGVDHDWASVLSVTDNRGNSADGHNNSNSSGNNSAGRGDGDPDRGGDRDRGGGGVTISTTSESVQETWMKAASPAGKPLDTVVNTFKVGSSARRGVKNSGGARARVDSTGSTGTNENKYYIGQGSPLNGGALSSGGGDGSHATFNLPVLSAYGLSMNHSLQNNNQIFSNRPSTGGAGVGVVSGVNRSIHHAAVNSGSVSVSSKSVGIKRVAHSSQGHSRSGNLR